MPPFLFRTLLHRLLSGLLLGLLLTAMPARADTLSDAIQALNAPDFAGKAQAIDTLAATGDPRALPILEAMVGGMLFTRKEDGRLVIGTGTRELTLTDAVTGEALGTATSRELSRITVNNSVRNILSAAVGRLQIGHPDPQRRLAAADIIARDPSPAAIGLLREALPRESVEPVRAAICVYMHPGR